MSRVVKNLRRCRPAGEVEDAGALHHRVVDVEERRGASGRPGRRAPSRPRRPRRRPRPASVERCCRSDAVGASLAPSSPGSRRPAYRCGRIRAHDETPVADLLDRRPPQRAAATESRSSRRSGGRRLTWAELDDEASRVAAGFGEAGLVAGYRVVVAMGNRIEFVTSYLGALRARLVAVPVNPRSTRRRAGPDDRRLRRPAGGRRRRHRRRGPRGDGRCVRYRAGELEQLDEAWARDPVLPLVVVVGAPPARASGATPTCRRRRPSAAAAAGPRDAGGAALHQRHLGTPARRDAQPPRAARQHRAGRRRRAADDHRATTWCSACCRSSTSTASTPCSAAACASGPGWCSASASTPAGTLDLIEDEAVSVVPVAPPVFAALAPMEDLAERLGPVRLVLSGSAPLGHGRGRRVRRRAPASRCTRATASPRPRRWSPRTLCSDARRGRARSARPCPGIEIRLVDDDGHDRPRARTRARSRSAAPTCSRGYWPDGDDGPDAEGWWATGDVGFLDPDGDLFLVDRLKELVIVSGFNVYPVEVEDVDRARSTACARPR